MRRARRGARLIARLWRTARRSLALLGIARREFVILLGLGLVVAAFEGIGLGLLVPVLLYVEQGPAAIDSRVLRAAEAVPLPTLASLLIFAFVPIVVRQVVRYIHQVRAETVRLSAIGRLRMRGFEAMLGGDLPFFSEERQGRLVNALTSQIEWGSTSFLYGLQIAEAAILLGVYSIVLALIAPWLLPMALLALVGVAGLVRVRIRRTSSFGARVTAALEGLHVIVAEKLAGIRLVKTRVQEQRETREYRRHVDELTDTLTRHARQKEAIEVTIEPVMVLGALAALYVAVSWFGMTLAGLGIVVFTLLRMVPSLKQMTSASQSLAVLTASLEEVHAVIDTARRSRTMTGGAIVFRSLQEGIRFERVGFRYADSPDAWALRDVSFTLARGTLTAIVGPSGSGKSTILDLIARLREPTEGAITFDGVPVTQFDVGSVRAGIGMVDQHGFLFHDTVANNIAYGVEGAPRAAVEDAARRAHADGFIAGLPRGYDTIVGDRGVRLSGGQRQRLSLARVLLQDPDVLLLDEPTSALDAESEDVIQEALADLARTKVVVVVAHRLSTIRRASQILVLRDGQIVERGEHTTLIAGDGAYRRLFDLQIHA